MLLFVNAAQAKVLTGRDDAEQAARVLTAWYPQVVIKLGADGALFYANGRPPVRVPAPPVERVIDGTGAGDAFVAGFLPAWLDKKPPTEALGSGCRLAAHALNLIGASSCLVAISHDGLPGGVVLAQRAGSRCHWRQFGDRRGDGVGPGAGRREGGARGQGPDPAVGHLAVAVRGGLLGGVGQRGPGRPGRGPAGRVGGGRGVRRA